MVIYANMKVIKSSMEKHGDMQIMKNHNLLLRHAIHALYHSIAIVWKSMFEFF